MRFVLVLLFAMAVSGCGYKGPLYMPDAKAKVPVIKPGPAIAPEPPPERPVPSDAAPAPK